MRAALLAGAALALLSGSAQAQGWYAGAFAGAAVTDSNETVGGEELVDLGGDALLLGARIGWGHRFGGGLYLGLEAEGFGASGRSRAVVNGEAYSWRLNGGAGGFARVGWQTDSRSALFFARAGALALFTSTGTETVPAIGAGAEVVISGPWFARIDLGYAWNDRELYTGTIGVGVRF